MRGKDADAINERLSHMEGLLDKLERSVDKIELVTVIREPNTGVAADAYNGLRKQIIAAVGERTSHLTQLAQFDAALRGGATTEDLASLVHEWLAQAGLAVVSEFEQAPAAFEMVGEGAGDDARALVLRPAYIETATERTVRMGVAERAAAPEPASAPISPETNSHAGESDAAPTDGVPSPGAVPAEPVDQPIVSEESPQ